VVKIEEQDDAGHSYRDVDQEDVFPSQGTRDNSTEDRGCDRGNCGRCPGVTHHPSLFPRSGGLVEDRNADREDHCRSACLEDPADDEVPEARREPARKRRGGEEDEPGEEKPVFSRELRYPPENEQETGLGDKVGREYPLGLYDVNRKRLRYSRKRYADDDTVDNGHCDGCHDDDPYHGGALACSRSLMTCVLVHILWEPIIPGLTVRVFPQRVKTHSLFSPPGREFPIKNAGIIGGLHCCDRSQGIFIPGTKMKKK